MKVLIAVGVFLISATSLLAQGQLSGCVLSADDDISIDAVTISTLQVMPESYGSVEVLSDAAIEASYSCELTPLLPTVDGSDLSVSPAPEPSPLAIALLSAGLIFCISRRLQFRSARF